MSFYWSSKIQGTPGLRAGLAGDENIGKILPLGKTYLL